MQPQRAGAYLGLKMLHDRCQVTGDAGAAALFGSLPQAQWMLADQGYAADWFRDDLQEDGVCPASPTKTPGTWPFP